MWRSLIGDEDGLTAVEYALLVAILVVGAILVWTSFGSITRNEVAASGNVMNGLPDAT